MEQARSVSRTLVSRQMALREMDVVAHVMEAWRSEVDWSTGIGQQSSLHLEVVSREVDNKEAGWRRRGSLHEYNGAWFGSSQRGCVRPQQLAGHLVPILVLHAACWKTPRCTESM